MKAQAAALAHKTEAGGVMLGIADAAALGQAWETLYANVARARPGLALEGVLVEAMGAPGLELAIGARRDPAWGPILMVGSGRDLDRGAGRCPARCRPTCRKTRSSRSCTG